MKPEELDILYSDNHLLVVNKPAGMPTQPNDTGEMSLEDVCKERVRNECNKPGNVYLHALHRIDKPVSGVVVFARTSKALSRLNESMRARETKKIYKALVSPPPTKEEGTLEHLLVHVDLRAVVVSKPSAEAKLARLHYKSERKDKHIALLEIELETGRYHQIRAQMSAIGSPIVGDGKYGSKESFKGSSKAIALQHSHFEIPHPVTKERLCFKAPELSWE